MIDISDLSNFCLLTWGLQKVSLGDRWFGIIHITQIRAGTIEQDPFKKTYLLHRIYKYRIIGFKLQGVTTMIFDEYLN